MRISSIENILDELQQYPKRIFLGEAIPYLPNKVIASK